MADITRLNGNGLHKELFGEDRPIDRALNEIAEKKLSGTFNIPTPTGSLTARFVDGLLHADDGPAWSETYGYDGLKLAWAKTGKILAINDNGNKETIREWSGGELYPVEKIDLKALGFNIA